ncbi:tellurite resistance protein [Oceanicola granulosus HTCC2516]|uniref:Tellurite resistance protein n=1 Tax=Oceanicola granulosus (strain ATCC BAA-861 / DSM 15982 / KCTC 12143 / HTCC2516) TaxID=314256 RepID=Q2CFF5_OCEGH|nr:TrgA family protein [Oceanicola granulosus]EAR51340.1 tellurite resistance protein [Oceanicola granulosus HTCC2516]
MPTFARLVAAILFGCLAWFVSETMIEPMFPEDFVTGWFAEVNAAVGVLCGWIIMGKRAGDGVVAATGIGFTTALMMVFWALFVHSFNDMLGRSLRKEYDGPVEALVAVFELGVEHLAFMSTLEVWAAILVGGIAAGVVTEYASRVAR